MPSLADINGPVIPRPPVADVRPFGEKDWEALGAFPNVPKDDPLAFHNPPPAMQEGYVGASAAAAYNEASRFLNYMLGHLPSGPFPQTVLDFGCGWGRMLRLMRFHEQLKGVELLGLDVSLPALNMIRRTVPNVWVLPVGVRPPSPLRDQSVDLIYAYSVFSHLPEDVHLGWARDFARMLRPGGTVCVTTQGKTCIRMCEDLRAGRRPVSHPWLERLAASFDDPRIMERYDAGEFLYSAQGGHGDPNEYGQAAVPPKYFERVWGELGFTVVDWNDDERQSRTLLRFKP